MAPLQLFKLRPRLYQVLKTVGATGQLFTANQVIKYIGKYIELKKLYDPKDVRMVNFKGDLLEEVFGVEKFLVGDSKDVWRIVFPSLIPATRKEIQDHEQNNKPSEETEEKGENASKLEHWWMSHLPWWYFVDKRKNEEADNATGSFLEASTALVEDTDYESEEKSCPTISSPGRFSLEYEPDSDSSESYNTDSKDDSDSTMPIDEAETLQNPTSLCGDDTETTSTDVSMDFEIPLEDHWRCGECSLVNPPTMGYCRRCWKLRKNWLPEKLNSIEPSICRSLTSPLDAETKLFDKQMNFDPGLQRSHSQPIAVGTDVPDGRLRTKSCEQNTINNHDEILPRKRTLDECDINHCNEEPLPKVSNLPSDLLKPYIPSKSQSSIATCSSSSSENKLNPNTCHTGVCNICHSNPNNATFVHRDAGHQYCCYKCAQKLRKRGKPCPVCRQPALLIVKNFIYTTT